MKIDKFKELEPGDIIHDRESGDEWEVIEKDKDGLRMKCTYVPEDCQTIAEVGDVTEYLWHHCSYFERGPNPYKEKAAESVTTTVAEAIESGTLQVGDEITITARVVEIHPTGLLITTHEDNSYPKMFILHGFNNIKYTPKQ